MDPLDPDTSPARTEPSVTILPVRSRIPFAAKVMVLLLFAIPRGGWGQDVGTVFLAGTARLDITPREPVPMWGYSARRDALSEGTLDPLFVAALVLQAGPDRLAVVTLDLGRSPSEESLSRIRARILREAGIEHSLISASHTHHGPVLELSDEEGRGRGRFDAALRYYRELEDAVVRAVVEAASRMVTARAAAGVLELDDFNRNRHSRLEPKPVDRELAVLRLDDEQGRTLALLVNFAAHPVMVPAEALKFSADYIGPLRETVESRFGGKTLFVQGAAGDLAVERGVYRDHLEYGRALGEEVIRLAAGLQPEAVPTPSLRFREGRFRYDSRTNFRNPLIRIAFSRAFFSELVENYLVEYEDGIRPRLSVAVLNRDIALVGVSGEFFCRHAIDLKRRARVPALFFFGYCNGYHQYFPTVEAVAEGGYGADYQVSPVAVGAGEEMMNRALIWIYQLRDEIGGEATAGSDAR